MKKLCRYLVQGTMFFVCITVYAHGASKRTQETPMGTTKSSTVTTVATKLDCQNTSTYEMKISVGTLPYVSIAANSTLSNISIPATVSEIHIKSSFGAAAAGTPITIQKSDLKIAADGKYDIVIRASMVGSSSLIITVYSGGEYVVEGTYLTA